MKKKFLLLFIIFNLNISLFATTSYQKGVDINFNDIGISLNQRTNNFNIKATLSYPLFAILDSSDKFDEASLGDFFETICFHGTVNYNLINFKSFFLNLGLGSDVFMQFDFSKEHSHFTSFTIGPYGEIGYRFKNNNKDSLDLSLSLTYPLIALENKPTNFMKVPAEAAWNELIDYNSSFWNLVLMFYKVNILIPF